MKSRWNVSLAVAGAGAVLGVIACSNGTSPHGGFGGPPLGGSGSGGTSSGFATASSSGGNSGSSGGTTSSGGSGSGSGSSSGKSSSGSGSGGGSGSGAGSGSSSGMHPSSSSGSSSGASSSGGGHDAGSSGSSGSSSGGPPPMGGCGMNVPPLSDYTQNGPFTGMMVSSSTGPSNAYTLYQPSPLGTLNGAPFKHPVITWGNGITTTPATYPTWLTLMASNGFIVIAANSSSVTPQNMSDGLDWVVQQNSAMFQGAVDETCLFTVGYSLGGAGSVTTGASHANVVATIGIHPASGSTAGMKGPLLLFTSDTDTVCVATTFVFPVFQSSPVMSFYADLSSAGDPSNIGHILPVVMPGHELDGSMAWLRMWAYGDQGGQQYFWGSNAILCQAPWQCQSKMAGGQPQMSGF